MARCSTAWLLVGVVPGAVLGAVTLTVVQPLWIKVVLYSLVALSALFSVYRSVKELRKTDQAASEEMEGWTTLAPTSITGATARVGIGLLVGLGSALTGTSGPVILLPILLTLQWDTLEALGSAQVGRVNFFYLYLSRFSNCPLQQLQSAPFSSKAPPSTCLWEQPWPWAWCQGC